MSRCGIVAKSATTTSLEIFFPSADELVSFKANIKEGSTIPDGIKSIIKSFPKDAHPMGITAAAMVALSGHYPNLIDQDLSDAQIELIRDYVSKMTIEGDLRREVSMNIKRLMDLSCYRGLRHRRGLPLRGQRTRTNARTRKGPRKAIRSR